MNVSQHRAIFVLAVALASTWAYSQNSRQLQHLGPIEQKGTPKDSQNLTQSTITLTSPQISNADINAISLGAIPGATPCTNAFDNLTQRWPTGNWFRLRGVFNGSLSLSLFNPPDENLPFGHHSILPYPLAWSGTVAVRFPTYTPFVTGPTGSLTDPTLPLSPWNGPVDPIVGTFASVTTGFPAPIPVPFSGTTRVLRLGNPYSQMREITSTMPFGAATTASNFTLVGTTPLSRHDGGADAIAVPFTVPPGMSEFNFSYAIVCEDPAADHAASQKPRFIFQLIDAATKTVVPGAKSTFEHVADSTNPFWNYRTPPGNPPNERLNWRQVSCHSVPITSAMIGRQLIALFIVTDCTKQGHFGYAYIGNFCNPSLTKPTIKGLKTNYCDYEPIVIDGSQTVGVMKYTWTVVQLDSSGNAIPTTLRSQTVNPTNLQIPNAFDVKTWYSGKGGVWTCDRRYKIILKLDTECSTDVQTEQIITVDCCEPGTTGGEGCCKDTPLTIQKLAPLTPLARPGDYAFSSLITWAGTASRVDATIANVVRAEGPTFSPLPSSGYVLSASPITASTLLNPVTPNLLFPRVARWETPLTPSGPGVMPMNLRFPAPPSGKVSFLKFTLKVVKTAPLTCFTCESYQTFAYSFDPTGVVKVIDPATWPKPVIINGGNVSGGVIGDPVPFPGRGGAGGMLENPVATVGAKLAQGRAGLSPIPGGAWVWPPNPVVNPHMLNCCGPQPGAVRRADLRMVNGTTTYGFTPVLNAPAAFPLVTRVEIAMINAVGATTNSSTFPTFGYQTGSPTVPPIFPTVQNGATPFSHITVWKSAVPAGVQVLNQGFPMTVVFPPPPVGGASYVHFTMRYTFYNRECRECSIYEKYYYMLERGKNPVPIDPKKWPIKLDTGGDPGGPPPNKRGGGVLVPMARSL